MIGYHKNHRIGDVYGRSTTISFDVCVIMIDDLKKHPNGVLLNLPRLDISCSYNQEHRDDRFC